MVSQFAIFVSIAIGVYGDAHNWMSKYDYGSKDGLMVCKEDKWMNGVCATDSYRRCQHSGEWRSNMVRCGRFVGQEDKFLSRTFVVGEWSTPVQCDIEQGYAAISACSSGTYLDCQTLDSNDWHSHHLQCAKGLQLVTDDTKEVYANQAGQSIQCPSGYAVYKFCASRLHNGCKDQDGNLKSHVIGCVRVAGDYVEDKDYGEDKDEDFLITKIIGFWKPQLVYSKKATASVSEGVETSEGMLMKADDAGKYGSSQDFIVGVTEGISFEDAPIESGFSQEYQRTVRDEVHAALTSSMFESNDLECGNDDDYMQDTVWQWYWKTETKDGNPGPVIKTNNARCAKSNKHSIMTRPRCAPGHCLDGAPCTVCTYDYCDVKLVQNTATGADTFHFTDEELNGAPLSTIDTFHFDRNCVDRKLDRKDWGEKRTMEVDVEYHREHHRAEHVRDGKVIQVGSVILRREAWAIDIDSSELPDTEAFPDAVGTWVPEHNTVSKWQEGDQFRILAEWENPLSAASPGQPSYDPTSAASSISIVLAASIALVSIFAL